MTDEQNPYAPPASDDQEAPVIKRKKSKRKGERDLRVWREGDAVVTYKEDARMPKRCVACNAPILGERTMRQFSWHPQWVFFLILIGWLPYLILASIMRKSAKVSMGLCAEHQNKRRQGLMFLWGGLAAMFVFIILGAVTDTPLLFVVGFAILIPAIIGGRMSNMVSPKKIDDHYIWLKVGPAFLASIPERDDWEA